MHLPAKSRAMQQGAHCQLQRSAYSQRDCREGHHRGQGYGANQRIGTRRTLVIHPQGHQNHRPPTRPIPFRHPGWPQ